MQKQSKGIMTTKVLSNCALLAALSVVMARLFGLMPTESVRFSIEAVPIFLAGLFFGPLPGALVGFTADFVGCMFSPYPYNPIFCVPPILYGVSAGLMRHYICARPNVFRLVIGWLPPIVLGSILYQSVALASAYHLNFLITLGERCIQFSITMVLDVLVVFLLCKTNIFKRMGLWPRERETS